jgi:cell division septation protein DedD
MAGMKGRSGGHNNRTLQEHLDRGTFRRDRHGHLSAQTTIPRAPAPVPENVVQGLHDRLHELDAAGADAPAASGALPGRRRSRATTPRIRQSSIRPFAAVLGQLRLEPMQQAPMPNPLVKYINRPSKWSGVLN